MTNEAAVARGSCFVFIRSGTAMGFDSSTRGGSLGGKKTSRTLWIREANVPSSSTSIPPLLSEDSTPAFNAGSGFSCSFLGTISRLDKMNRLNGRGGPEASLPLFESRATTTSAALPVFAGLFHAARGFWPHDTFYKTFRRHQLLYF